MMMGIKQNAEFFRRKARKARRLLLQGRQLPLGLLDRPAKPGAFAADGLFGNPVFGNAELAAFDDIGRPDGDARRDGRAHKAPFPLIFSRGPGHGSSPP